GNGGIGRLCSGALAGERLRGRAWRGPCEGGAVRRFLLFVLLLALALPALVVLATNVVLQTKLLRSWVNTKPESTFIDYASASSDFPGRLTLRKFVLRSRDEGTEWIARVDEARLTVRLFDLFSK